MRYTIYRRLDWDPWRYGVLRGGPWPVGEVVGITLTLRGARRKAKRDARKTNRSADRATVVTLDL